MQGRGIAFNVKMRQEIHGLEFEKGKEVAPRRTEAEVDIKSRHLELSIAAISKFRFGQAMPLRHCWLTLSARHRCITV
jgi:hypothetical protein